MRKMVVELQAMHEVEAQKVWEFLGRTEMALAPFSLALSALGNRHGR
jgi:hypothetical protein